MLLAHCSAHARRAAALATFAAAMITALFAVGAHADTAGTLTVVGTSDVNDSGLIPNLIAPEFENAYPQYVFKYVPGATGVAIAQAESGSQNASVLIVHAASLENQFVSGGYSYEPYGRAIFTNDFVLGGPISDPAGVLPAQAHDIVGAFADIATAGMNGTATFVSRGSTPGTTVEEHQLWALVAALPNPPSGLLLCSLSTANGGGETPIGSGHGVTADGQSCPANPNGPGDIPTGALLPAWYVVTGAQQGANVLDANACNGYPNGANSCYVLTDRGTYDYLASGTDAAGTIPNLQIVTRNNSSGAPGGADALINYFHAYIVNPSKPNETVNLPAAQAFLNFLTSPGFQSQLKNYLADTTDPGGPPFVADASPILTANGFPATVNGGSAITVTGTVANAQPDYAAPAGQPVTLNEIAAGLPVPVATATTDSSGNYSIRYTPTANATYQVSTGQITLVENSTLSPVFGDILSPAATATSTVNVQAGATISGATISGAGAATVTGTLSPAAPDGSARVTLLARPAGSTGSYAEVGGATLTAGASTYTLSGTVPIGATQFEVTYSDPGALLAGTAGPVTAQPGAASPPPPNNTQTHASVGFKKLSDKKGTVTVKGSLGPRPSGSAGKVTLIATRADGHGHKTASATIAIGRARFTVHVKLAVGHRWILQLKYKPSGSGAGFSKLRSLAVH